MEAREVLDNPSFVLESDPYLFLRGVTYLDAENPLDRLLIDYKNHITYHEPNDSEDIPIVEDHLPTEAEQTAYIEGIRSGDLESARQLVKSHKGLIAAVAYPFKYKGTGSDELLRQGIHALIGAAKTYEKDEEHTFYDYAADAIHAAYTEAAPDLAGDSFVELNEHPMIGVYQFLEALVVPTDEEEIKQMRKQVAAREKRRLSPDELMVLPLLHLTEKQIGEAIDEGPASIRKAKRLVGSLKWKLGAGTKEEAALLAYQRGLEYDMPDIPADVELTIEERLVAMRLWSSNEAIAEELEMTETRVQRIRVYLTEKMKARSRAEIVLMAHRADLEPTEEEKNPPKLSLAEQLTPLEQRILQYALSMKDKEIAEQPDIELNDEEITSAIGRLIKRAKVEHNHRTALILKLHKQGMEFDLPPLSEPITDLLYAHELEIGKSLDLPYKEIIKKQQLNYSVERLGEVVNNAQKKVGARTRAELALMIRVYDDGKQALKKDDKTNGWRLAKRLGVKSLSLCDVAALMEGVSDKEREAVDSYYLADTAVTWPEICRRKGVTLDSLRMAGDRAVGHMRRKLEENPSLDFSR